MVDITPTISLLEAIWVGIGMFGLTYAGRNARRTLCTVRHADNRPDGIIALKLVRDRLTRETVVFAVQVALLAVGFVAMMLPSNPARANSPALSLAPALLLIAAHIGLAYHSYLIHRHSESMIAAIFAHDQAAEDSWDGHERRRKAQEGIQ